MKTTKEKILEKEIEQLNHKLKINVFFITPIMLLLMVIICFFNHGISASLISLVLALFFALIVIN